MNALVYRIRAEGPLLMTGLGGDPNSSVSCLYVPGSALRGALVNRHSPGGIRELTKAGAARGLFFGDNIRYLNAYPLDRLGRRTLPTPFSWLHDKHTPLTAGARVADLSNEEAACPDEPKGMSEAFCWLDGDEVEFYQPEVSVNVHTARERTKGRATPDKGAVFRYEAIAAGARFGGAILSADDRDLTTLRDLLLGGDLWLGGSRSGSYGRVSVLSTEIEPWAEIREIEEDLCPADRLVLTLLSDAILRGADGAYADALLPEFLPEPVRTAISLSPAAVFKRLADVGGFNRRWGLPLDQAPAVLAGSVFVYDVVRPIPADALRQLQQHGVGERRLDGFGRVGVNWHAEHPVLTVREIPEAERTDMIVKLTGESRALAEAMTGRWLRQDLDRRLADYVHNLGARLERMPSRAQLSRLRVVALNALPSRDVRRLLAFLCDGNLKASARDQYLAARVDGVRLLDWLTVVLLNAVPTAESEALHTKLQQHEEAQREKRRRDQEQDEELKRYGDARINGKPLAKWLEERLKQPAPIWNRLSRDEIPPRVLGDVKTGLTDELAQEYTIRLVAGLLHRATKEVSE